ncbi:hypothetical protein RB597_000207 [Gaeumannomyces tritici]
MPFSNLVPTQPASPLARRPKVVMPSSPLSPTIDLSIDSDSDDAAQESTLPATRSRHFTQATQIVDRPTLKPSAPSLSSSRSASPAVEVPASSPFRQNASAASGRLASAMAPRGTSFRPPPAQIRQSRQTNFRPPQVLGKRSSPVAQARDPASSPREAIYVGDSSADERPARGDIPRTSFNRNDTKDSATASSITSPNTSSAAEASEIDIAPKGSILEKRLERLIYSTSKVNKTPPLSKIVPNRTLLEYQTALLRCGEDKDEAATWLLDNPATKKARQDGPKGAPADKKASKNGDVRNFIRSFAHGKPDLGSSKATPMTVDDSDMDEIVAATPDRKPTKRLQRGRRPGASPVSSPVKSAIKPQEKNPQAKKPQDAPEEEASEEEEEEEEPIAITDDDDSDSDAYDSPEPQDDNSRSEKENRVLKYLNECELNGLLAICGSSKQKKDGAKAMIKARPLRTLAAAKDVTVTGNTKGRKSKVEVIGVGEDIVYEVSRFIKSLDAIDQVVRKCDEEGVRMKSITDHWNMDSRGVKITDQRRDGQLTPSSADGHPLKVRDLPISREPKMMQGRCTMKSYQLWGLNWLHQLYQRKFGCILADDMGLGKTCQIISFMSHIVESYDPSSGDERPWPNLIVVPPSTFDNWQGEFKKFAPKIKVTVYHGKDREWLGDDIRHDPEEHHVVLTTYTQLGRTGERDHTKIISRIHPNVAIFDEGHNLKNSKTKLYKDLCRITANWRVLLTGTPVQNNLMEMINLLNFIQPQLFDGQVETLKDLFDQKVTLQEVSNGAMLFSDRVRRARSILEPFILQRQKEQVLDGFPPKTSRVVYCDMDEAQKKIYYEYHNRFRNGKDVRGASTATNRTSNDQNNVWMQLRKAAIHSQLFRRHFTDKMVEDMADVLMRKVPQRRLKQENKKHLIAELKDLSDFELHVWCVDEPCVKSFDVDSGSWMRSGKVQHLLELLREFRRNGDRALVFTRFAKVNEILSECLVTADLPHLSFQGSTAVELRQDLIDQFNEDKDITAFLLTTGAGGTGINLATANKVIIFDQSDNPQDDVQAENRAHRFGQTRPVEVIRLLSRGTVEELVYRACQKKLELAKRVTGAGMPVGDEIDVEAEVRQMLAEEEK